MSTAVGFSNAVAGFFDQRLSRRTFTSRAAMAGSAVAVVGADYVLRPGTAYAAICSCPNRRDASSKLSCSCGALCCDGYTEFCCHIYGQNSCPPDTILAGWWKVDRSTFCDGAARYYMDCNRLNPGCTCGYRGVCRGPKDTCQCRSCSNRADGCTVFRYGNCNNDVTCVGAIVCRVVTCTKPWEIDPGCSTVPRTDPATANHHRACLIPEVDASPQAIAWAWSMYVDYLNREPTKAELDQIAKPATAGQNRVKISSTFSRSDAYVQTYLEGLYQSVLGRSADEGGKTYWTNFIRAGANPTDVGAEFYASDEFFGRAGSDEAYVESLYEKLLERSSDPEGHRHWLNVLRKTKNRNLITKSFYRSIESRRQRVEALYQHFLGRPADAGGLEHWAKVLERHDDLKLATFLTGSKEYFDRAQVRFA